MAGRQLAADIAVGGCRGSYAIEARGLERPVTWRQLAYIAAGIDRERHKSRGLEINIHVKLYMESNIFATISFDSIF